MTELVADLQARLQARAQPDKRRWWEQYLRGEARFRGVPMGEVRTLVQAWYRDFGILEMLDDGESLRLLAGLVRSEWTEDKLAAALVLQEVLVPAGRPDWRLALARIEPWFDDGHLGDWNVVDWFSVKALFALFSAGGPDCGQEILRWTRVPGLWRARAGLVTFANVASRGKRVFPGFVEEALEGAAHLIAREERFAKTAVGWVLRELREAESVRVDAFLHEHLADFSTEALRNALKHATPDERRSVLERFREVAP